jgi:DNA-directed RNA polymerase subunit M/transcription elongation factor TFIIS
MVTSGQNAKQWRVKKSSMSAVYVVDESKEHYAKVTRPCPNCESDEAFHWFSRVSGEHAGIRRERTVEHFKCAKCSHTWTESS